MRFKILAGIAVAVLVVATVWFFKWLFVDNYPKVMTNQEIVDQVKFCEKNNLKTERFMIGLTGETTRIECRSKE